MCHTDYEFIHRMTQNLCGGIPDETITHGFSQRRPIRSVQIPPGIGICPTKKNLCISVKSVGQNNPHEEKSASSAKSAWQKQQEHISGASHWPAAKVPRKSVSNPISKNASDSSVKSDEKNEETKKWRNEKMKKRKNEETKKVCHELHDTPYFIDCIFLRFQRHSNTIAQH